MYPPSIYPPFPFGQWRFVYDEVPAGKKSAAEDSAADLPVLEVTRTAPAAPPDAVSAPKQLKAAAAADPGELMVYACPLVSPALRHVLLLHAMPCLVTPRVLHPLARRRRREAGWGACGRCLTRQLFPTEDPGARGKVERAGCEDRGVGEKAKKAAAGGARQR